MPLGAVLQSLIEVQGAEDRREQGAVCAAAPVALSQEQPSWRSVA
jgi:hypothetical protein